MFCKVVLFKSRDTTQLLMNFRTLSVTCEILSSIGRNSLVKLDSDYVWLFKPTNRTRLIKCSHLINLLCSKTFHQHWLFKHQSLFFHMTMGIRETLLFLPLRSLAQLSHYIFAALWWERYSTPTHLSFELICARHPPPAVCTDQNLLSQWALCSSAITIARDDRGVLYVRVWVSVSMHKGPSSFNMQKRCQVCDYTSR